MDRRYVARALAGLTAAAMLTISTAAFAGVDDDRLLEMNKFLAAGDYVAATLILEQGASRKMVNGLRSNKAYKAGLLGKVGSRDLQDARAFDDAFRAVGSAVSVKLLSQVEAANAQASLVRSYAARTADGSVKGSLFDHDGLTSAAPDDRVFNLAVIRNTLSDDREIDDLLGRKLVAFINKRQGAAAMRAEAERLMPTAKISIRALKGSLTEVSTDVAEQLVRARVKPLRVVADGDGLLALDLKDQLNRYDEVVVVDQDGPGVPTVVLKQIGLTISELPSTSEVVNVSQSDINIFSAALLMPKYSKYSYTLNRGGVDYEFAYEMTDPAGKRRILRDRKSLPWTACSGMQVVNAFGGSEPVTWMANSEMSRRCSMTRRVTPREARLAIVNTLAAAVVETVAPDARPPSSLGGNDLTEGTPGYEPPPLGAPPR